MTLPMSSGSRYSESNPDKNELQDASTRPRLFLIFNSCQNQLISENAYTLFKREPQILYVKVMKDKLLLLSLAALLAYFVIVGEAEVTKGDDYFELVYDDFDDGFLGTNLGGAAGTMSNTGVDDPQVGFDASSAYQGNYGLEIRYSLSPPATWIGYWSKVDEWADTLGYDLSRFNTLEMWVKGASGGEQFKVELKDVDGGMGSVYVTSVEGFSGGLTTEWKELAIRLTRFGTVNLAKVKELNIVFDRPESSTIYLDYIRFLIENTSVEISPPAQGVIGEDNFAVNIDVDPLTEIAGIQLSLSFDPSLAYVESVTEENLFSTLSTTFSWDNENFGSGVVRIEATPTAAGSVSSKGTFTTVHMRAKRENGTSALQLENVQVVDTEGRSVTVKLQNGEVTVTVYPDWDVNRDNTITTLDFIPILNRWGETDPSHRWILADVYRDGIIDVSDMVLVAQRWTR